MSKSVRQATPPSQVTYPDPLPGIITFGSVNLLAGASGVGKTCLTAWLLTRFRDGAEIFGRCPNIPAKIVYLSADRGWQSTRSWLDRAGYGDITFYSITDDPTFSLTKLQNSSKKALSRVDVLHDCLLRLDLVPNTLVIIDPIALFLGGNLNDYDTCAISLIGIRRLCQEFGITIIGLAHAAKQKADKREQYTRLQDRILGSAAQHGYGDTQMYLAGPEETGERFYTFLWHPHLAEAEAFPLGRDAKTGLFLPYDQVPRSACELQLLAGITEETEGTAFADLLVCCAPTSRATVYRTLQDLLHAGQVLKAGHGRYRKAKLQ